MVDAANQIPAFALRPLWPEMCHESAGRCSRNGSLKDWLRSSVGMPGDCANVRPALPEDHSAWLLGQHGMCFVS